MQFHPLKCQVVRVTHKLKPLQALYTIHIEVVNTAKYLGLRVDSKINFNAYVDITVKKAKATHAFLGRNIQRRQPSLSNRYLIGRLPIFVNIFVRFDTQI